MAYEICDHTSVVLILPLLFSFQVLKALELLRRNKKAKPTQVLSIEQLIAEAYSAIDKAVRKGVLHRNTGKRRKSRLARKKTAVEIHHGWYTPAPPATV